MYCFPSIAMHSPETPSAVLDAALRAAALGLRIHPLRRKHAILEDWPTIATADCSTIRGWLAGGEHNYGIVCDRVAVIDTDLAELTAWWEKNMSPDALARVDAWRRDALLLSGRARAAERRQAHQGWDVRAGGRGYVVGAGSVVDGKAYELLGEETLDLPPFDPAWLPAEAIEAVALPRW